MAVWPYVSGGGGGGREGRLRPLCACSGPRPPGYKAAEPAGPDKVLASCDVTSGPRGCPKKRTRQPAKDAAWALGPAERQPRRRSRTCSAPEPRITVSWVAAGGAQRGLRGALAAFGDPRQPPGSGDHGPQGREAAHQGIVAAGSRVARERSVGEGDLEALGTAPLPAALRPRGQVPATGLAQELGRGERDLGEVVSLLVFSRLLKRCF